MFKATTNKASIHQLPFTELGKRLLLMKSKEDQQAELDSFYSTHKINKLEWVLPQAQAHLVEKFPAKREGDKYTVRATFTALASDPFSYALLRVLTEPTLSQVVKSQTKTPHYSAIVPIVLAAYKKFKDIKYSEWSKEGLQHICGPDVYRLMTLDYERLKHGFQYWYPYKRTAKFSGDEFPMSSEALAAVTDLGSANVENLSFEDKILWIRNNCLSSGTKSFTIKLSDTPLAGYPKAVAHAILQTWVAHPEIRSSYAILDPRDWDKQPEPLVSTEVVISDESNEMDYFGIPKKEEGPNWY